MTRPGPKEVKAMTEIAGVPQDSDVSARIANSIGPAFDGFAAVAARGLQLAGSGRAAGGGKSLAVYREQFTS